MFHGADFGAQSFEGIGLFPSLAEGDPCSPNEEEQHAYQESMPHCAMSDTMLDGSSQEGTE